MSILIKGMEMPKNCEECRFYVEGASYCKGYRLYEADMNAKRQDDCPLIEIPHHGDLIDRDALYNEAYYPWDGMRYEDYKVIDEIDLYTAPVVIPAESEEE